MKKILNLVIITIIIMLTVSCDHGEGSVVECIGEVTFGEVTS
jgi:hypothetical protein